LLRRPANGAWTCPAANQICAVPARGFPHNRGDGASFERQFKRRTKFFLQLDTAWGGGTQWIRRTLASSFVANSAAQFSTRDDSMKTKKAAPRAEGKRSHRLVNGLSKDVKRPSRGQKGEELPVRVTKAQIPGVDVSQVRRRTGLSQTQFAPKFGFPPATVRNWEQGRVHPETPTRVLLALVARHPESVEDVLKDVRRIRALWPILWLPCAASHCERLLISPGVCLVRTDH